MSDNVLWIHDPQMLTVCDEYVYALRNTLGDINARLRSQALVWSEPAERALALWVSLSSGFSIVEVWGEDPVGHAARALGEHIPRHRFTALR